eukprot:11813796-Alexandrium_andersonii.AAC.1
MREVLGSVASVPVVLGSVDRFGSVDMCRPSLPPLPPQPPTGRFGTCAKTKQRRIRPSRASGSNSEAVS